MARSVAHLAERAAERLREMSGLPEQASDAMSQAQPSAYTDGQSSSEPSASRAQAQPDEPGQRVVSVRQTAPDDEITNRRAPVQASDEWSRRDEQWSGTARPKRDVVPGRTDVDAAQSGRAVDMSALENGGLVVGRAGRTVVADEFRVAAGHVLRTIRSTYTEGHAGASVVLVTSSRPGEGKSFSALNLAASMARQSRRDVILVDADAKERPTTDLLGLSDAPGMLNLIHDPVLRVEDLILPTAIASLSFLPIGPRLARDSESHSSRPMTAIIESLARRFANTIIVIDAPPCLSTSEPSEIAAIVGQILMIVEAETTQRRELEAALEMLRACPTIMLLLNKIRVKSSHSFGAYHYSGTYS
jgi:protein-tyrosine kinase